MATDEEPDIVQTTVEMMRGELPLIGRERVLADKFTAQVADAIKRPQRGPYERRRGAAFDVLATGADGFGEAGEERVYRVHVELMSLGAEGTDGGEVARDGVAG